MGAVGLFPRYGYDRLLTSARISAYVDGTTEMQNERIGAALLKRYGQGPLNVDSSRPVALKNAPIVQMGTNPLTDPGHKEAGASARGPL